MASNDARMENILGSFSVKVFEAKTQDISIVMSLQLTDSGLVMAHKTCLEWLARD
jgi:hypothetical protein